MAPVTSLFTFVLLCASPLCQGATNAQQQQGGANSDVYYMTEMADRFTAFTAKHAAASDSSFLAENERLESAIRNARSMSDKDLLEEAAVANEESRIETQGAFNEMRNFMTTLKYAMGASGSAASCEELTCGERAYCSILENNIASCQCEEGYEGNGFVCKSPTSFRAQTLIDVETNESPPQVADVHVGALGGGRVAVVYRDVSKGNAGYIMLGTTEASRVSWGPPTSFSNGSQAFGPVLASAGDGVIAVAFRNQDRGGDGLLTAGRVLDAGQVVFSAPRAFARSQAQGMSVVALPGSHVAVLFAEHVLSGVSGALSGGAMYGTSVLAKVLGDGSPPEVVGKHRFASGPIARLTATLLAPSHFVVAYRQGDNGRGSDKAEASCMHAQLQGTELVFDPHPMLLEPGQTQIWARSVAPIQENVFAYTYHSGNEQATKQAILQIDPKTHRMSFLQEPKVIARGFTPYVGTVSAAFMTRNTTQLTLLQESGPRLFSFFARQDTRYGGSHTGAQARLCKVDGLGVPAACHDLDWANGDLAVVSGAPVGDGRLLLVFTDTRGSPRYQLVGLMESD